MQTQWTDFICISLGFKEDVAQVSRWTTPSFKICFCLHVSWEIYNSVALLLPVIKKCGIFKFKKSECKQWLLQKLNLTISTCRRKLSNFSHICGCLRKLRRWFKKIIIYVSLNFSLLAWSCGEKTENMTGSKLPFRHITRLTFWTAFAYWFNRNIIFLFFWSIGMTP